MTTLSVANDSFLMEAEAKIRAPLRFEAIGHYDVSPPRLFAAVSEPAAMSKWLPMLKSLHMDHGGSANGPGACGVGSERHCTFAMMGDVSERVLWWNPPHGYAFTFQPKSRVVVPTRNHSVVFLVNPHGAGGSEFVFRTYFDWQPGPMRLMAGPMFLMMLNMSLANLKKQLGGAGGKARRVH